MISLNCICIINPVALGALKIDGTEVQGVVLFDPDLSSVQGVMFLLCLTGCLLGSLLSSYLGKTMLVGGLVTLNCP